MSEAGATAPGLLGPEALGLAVALGAGLLVGIERERRKGRGDGRAAAGVRSFALAGVLGGLAQWLPAPGLVLAGAALVVALAVVSHARSRAPDPGMTTELALFATYLIGVQSVLSPALGAALAAGLAALLAARDRLHRFATELLSEQELHDGLVLAALALIVLPLVPATPIEALGGIAARPLAALVLLILAMQAAGQLALRWLGPRAGLLAGGFVSGFVSSTATIASLGARARAEPAQARWCAGGGAMSAVATWAQAIVMVAVLAPAALPALVPVALAGALATLAAAFAVVGRAGLRAGSGAAPAAAEPQEGTRLQAGATTPSSTAPAEHSTAAHASRSALRPREALAVAALLAVVAVAVSTAREFFGTAGLYAGTALAALADAHAPIASLASLHAAGTLPSAALLTGALVAITANSLTRTVVAAVSGGGPHAGPIGLALVAGLAAAWGLAAALGRWPSVG